MERKIKYYPVGNGDQTLIQLSDGTSILVDCNIRQSSIGSKDPKIYDVKKDLLSSIQRRDDNPFMDVFVLTHGDQDHCRGYIENFYQGDPSKYGKKNRDAGEIIIDEMWFSPMIAEEYNNTDDETAYQEEAERRLELHLKKDPDRDKPGNRIRIIGYDGSKDYSSLWNLRSVPGDEVRIFNGKLQDCFSVFIHAPFKEQLASADNKNLNSIVFQARFKERKNDTTYSGLVMFGGDADYIAWSIIHERTIRKKNEEALYWDLFLAPHHCSWTYFNEHNKEEAEESSLEILRYRRMGGQIIASSKEIFDDDDNPPSYRAKKEYIKMIDDNEDFFLNTDTYPAWDAPKPIVFIITANGPAREPHAKIGSASGAAGGLGAASTIVKQG